MTDILGRVVRGAWRTGKALPMHARGMQPENKKREGGARGSRLQGRACRRTARSRQVLHRRLAKATVSKRRKELDATTPATPALPATPATPALCIRTPACAVRRAACKEWREVSKMDMADRGRLAGVWESG